LLDARIGKQYPNGELGKPDASILPLSLWLILQVSLVQVSPNHAKADNSAPNIYSFDAFLSLGFGRYQTTRTDAVDEEAFLRARLDQPIPRPGTSASLLLYGDTYLTSITQLSKLVRALVSWTERETSGMTPSSQRNEGLLSMLRDLNGRLDEWSKLWVWSGKSPGFTAGNKLDDV
jgi:hypothetical protein